MHLGSLLQLLVLSTAALLHLVSSESPIGNCSCPQGFKQVEMRKRVCTDGACEPRKLGSLGFIIDSTGSMGAEIFAIRGHISAIMENNIVFKDFVIAAFGDPYVKKAVRSSKLTAIKSFVNAIIPAGGGDCPEFAMSGIEDAAKEARDSSVLILFTDAAAKDANKTAEVTALLESKNTKLFVIATGRFCEPGVYKREFHDIAEATGGSVMTLAKISVNEALDFIAKAAAGKYSMDSFPKSLGDLKRMEPMKKCCKWIIELKCKEIEEPCPFGLRRVTMHNRVCSKPKECSRKPRGSLGFVIDDSASMGAEIFAMRSHISSIISNNSVFEDYVVARFNDPYVKSVVRSSDKSSIQSFVDAATPHGGGDCPEFAMSGIEDAAKEARDSSVLILFTDAAAKYSL